MRFRRTHPLYPDWVGTSRYANDDHRDEEEMADMPACGNFHFNLRVHMLVSAFRVPYLLAGNSIFGKEGGVDFTRVICLIACSSAV